MIEYELTDVSGGHGGHALTAELPGGRYGVTIASANEEWRAPHSESEVSVLQIYDYHTDDVITHYDTLRGCKMIVENFVKEHNLEGR